MAKADNLVPLVRAEHISPDDTGDNISAKRVAEYLWNGADWQRNATPLIDGAYDYIGYSNPDSNGNYQTITYKTGGSGGTTVRTLDLTYDTSNNVTSVTRT